jgi:hypothetical protein
MSVENETKKESPKAPRCAKENCNHYASYGDRCGQVECPSRKRVTAVQTGESIMMVDSAASTRRYPSTRTNREYD